MFSETHEEWVAWKLFVQELRALGIEINDQDKLNKLVKEWGKRFAELCIKEPKILTDKSLQR